MEKSVYVAKIKGLHTNTTGIPRTLQLWVTILGNAEFCTSISMEKMQEEF